MSKDIIYREDAIKAIKEHHFFINNQCKYPSEGCVEVIEDAINVPSTDRPQGEWVDKGRNLWRCSNCGMEIYSESERDRNEFHKWCSRCGARMKGADNEMS